MYYRPLVGVHTETKELGLIGRLITGAKTRHKITIGRSYFSADTFTGAQIGEISPKDGIEITYLTK